MQFKWYFFRGNQFNPRKAIFPAHGPLMIFTCSTLLVIHINLNLVPLHSPKPGYRFLRSIRPLTDRVEILYRILGTIFSTLYRVCTVVGSTLSWKETTHQRIDLIHLNIFRTENGRPQKIMICKSLTISNVGINSSGLLQDHRSCAEAE